eukprot:909650-Pelagomonas_calceolata.AAC.2
MGGVIAARADSISMRLISLEPSSKGSPAVAVAAAASKAAAAAAATAVLESSSSSSNSNPHKLREQIIMTEVYVC